MRHNIFICIIILLNLQSCGFYPVYSNRNDPYIKEKLSSIKVESINSIYGSEFYHRMKNILPPQKNEQLTLKVSLNYTKTSVIIQTNSDVLTNQDKLTAKYKLTDTKTEEEVTSGYIVKYSSYSSAFAAYPNDVQQDKIRRNLAIAVADDIHTKFILYFQNLKKQNTNQNNK